EAAAQVYFGVSARHLDPAQAAFLAALPRSPVEHDVTEELVRERQAYVLTRMIATGVLGETRAAAVEATALDVVPADPPFARHLAAAVHEELLAVLPEHAGDPGLVIESTLDPARQREAERRVRTGLARLERQQAGSAAVVT